MKKIAEMWERRKASRVTFGSRAAESKSVMMFSRVHFMQNEENCTSKEDERVRELCIRVEIHFNMSPACLLICSDNKRLNEKFCSLVISKAILHLYSRRLVFFCCALSETRAMSPLKERATTVKLMMTLMWCAREMADDLMCPMWHR